jgi:Replication-relaxation
VSQSEGDRYEEAGTPTSPRPSATPPGAAEVAPAEPGAGGPQRAPDRTPPPGGTPASAIRLVQESPRRVVAFRTAAFSDARLTRQDVIALRRSLLARDVCVLSLLAQHRYLTTSLIQALAFPSLRSAQKRLQWLALQGLVVRGDQLEPTNGRWRRHSSVFMLSERGATVVAACQGLDPKPFIRRAWVTAHRILHLEHTLEANAFFVALAEASRDRPNEGLYHWIGDDSMRANFQARGIDLAPDGWGRYLVGEREITFMLEWDRGTELPQRISAKAAAYAEGYAGRPYDSDHVLFVAPSTRRESTIRTAIVHAVRHAEQERFWTASVDLLHLEGTLGMVWSRVGVTAAERALLAMLPGPPTDGTATHACIAKTAWWKHRPWAGEGA